MSRKEHWEKAYSTKGENEVSWFARGFKNVTVLDLSEAALAVVKARLADKAKCVQWIAADVTRWYPSQTYDLWHDRATFHFLTEQTERASYVNRLTQSVRSGGQLLNTQLQEHTTPWGATQRFQFRIFRRSEID